MVGWLVSHSVSEHWVIGKECPDLLTVTHQRAFKLLIFLICCEW